MSEPIPPKEEVDAAINRLVDRYRAQCLWFSPLDYYPRLDDQRLRTLKHIETNGDREAFKRSRELRDWLLHYSRQN